MLASLMAGGEAAVAAPVADDLADCKIRRWTTEDGLPQNRIACIQQTRDGYLWLGTWFGLARFDGVRFTVFNSQNTPALTNDTINALAEDSEGSLWIGTREGLVKYQNGKFHRFTVKDGLPHDDIWQLSAARSGGLWVQAGNQIIRCLHDKFSMVWQHPEGDRVSLMQEGADGRLNIMLVNQWLVLSPVTGLLQTNFAELVDLKSLLNAGLSESPDVAFAGTESGLRQLERGKTNIVFVGGLEGVRADFVLHDHAGKVWAQTRTNGLMRFDGTNWQAVGLEELRNDVVCAAQDAQGNYWFGTADGLVQLRFQKVRTCTTRDGLPDDNVATVCEDADGVVWAGTDHGLVKIQDSRAEAVTNISANPMQPIRSVWPSRDGGVWVGGHYDAFLKLKAGKVRELIPGDQLPGMVNVFYEDKSGRLWIGTSAGVSCFQDGKLETPLAGTEPLREVPAIEEDRAGNFWFGMRGGGLARLHDGQLAIFDAHDGLLCKGVWAIHETADGALWLGTENGLVRFVNGKFFQFSARHQMLEDAVNCILEDDAGCLWLSTLHGIWRVGRTQLDAVADSKAATVQPDIIGTADGMKTSESNGETQPAGWKAHDGRLWFPTGKGLVVIDPRLFAEKESPPPVVLESVKADGRELFSGAGFQPAQEPIETHGLEARATTEPGTRGLEVRTTTKIKVAAGRGHALEFSFTACDLAAPEQVRFCTRLAGVDNDWSAPSANRTANYFNLRPGAYQFEVKAMDHHGQWSVPAMLAFSIAPHFWQTVWFYVLCALAVFGLAGGWQAYRLQWQHRLLMVEQQRALAGERTRIARDLHDDLGTALTGMALELDVLGRDVQDSPPLAGRLGKASQHIRHLAERMREVVWVVNPRCDNLRSLADFLEDQAALLLRAAGLKVGLEFPLEIPELPVDANVRHQLALSVREAFTNLIRHARATEANVRLELTPELLSVVIRDNGCGFEPQQHLDKEHGMINMRVRMETIGGSFQCASAPRSGTTITFSVPLAKVKSIREKS